MNTNLADILASYLPVLVKQRLIANPQALAKPESEQFPAATLFADISGFTTLTEHLQNIPSQYGLSGAEVLTQILNDYFGQLIDLVIEHGGDVVKFAGDALVAMWPVRTRLIAAPNVALATVIRRAAQCALAVQQTLHNYPAVDDFILRMRIGISAGEVSILPVGGMFKRWELLMSGKPLVQMNLAEQQARPGEVVFSPAAWALVQKYCTGESLSSDNTRLVSVNEPLPLLSLQTLNITPETEAALRAYIPGAVLARLSAGHANWLAELRRVTVIFVKLPDFNHTTGDTPDYAQTVMYALQKALYHYEGSINKLSVDDKGTMLVAALGLPPLAHEDDATRGVQAALEAHDELDKLGVRHAIGITTGDAFCGTVGNNARREYTMIGDVVNMAARLMQAAPGQAQNDEAPLLCDANTYNAAQQRIIFEELSPITLKGKVDPVPIYRPLNEVLHAVIRPKTEIVGREAERTRFGEAMQALLRGGQGDIIIVEGETGIGKSRLLADVIDQAEAVGITTLFGAGDAIEKSTPYYAWRGVFNQLLDINVLTDPAARRQHVLDLLELEEDLYPLAPLLDDVLGLQIPDNDLTKQMSAEARSENTRNLLIRLLQASVTRSPKVLILEDAHWLDSASWTLALRVSQRVHPLLMVIATRPIRAEIAPAEYYRLQNATTTTHMLLEALTSQQALTLVTQRLGVANLPKPVAELILRKAEGHPLFSEELAYALRDAGVIEIKDGVCHLTTEISSLQTLDLPNTLQGIITSRIDRLIPAQQLTLKVASVIGRVFAYGLLHDVYPIAADKISLKEYLEALRKLEITPLETPEPKLAYIFKHIITREAAYNLMAFSQRQQLHHAVAKWHEQHYTDDLSPYYPLLAYHWSRATIGGQDATLPLSKAVYYLEKAGEQALRSHANQETIHFFDDLVSLDAKLIPQDHDAHQLNRARWQRQLAAAYIGLGQYADAGKYLQRALALLGQPEPSTLGGLALRVLYQVLRQAWHRVRPNRARRQSPHEVETILEAARAYARLGEVYYIGNETVPAVHASLITLNLAEKVGPSPELAEAYSNICLAATLIPSRQIAKIYSRRSLDTAAKVNHLPSQAFARLATGLYNIGFGQWENAHQATQQSNEIYTRLGDWGRWGDTMAVMAQTYYYQGKFERGAELYAQLYERARHNDNMLQQAWGLNGQALNLIRLGHTTKALELMQTAAKLLVETPNRSEEIVSKGQLALAWLRLDNYDNALQATQHNAELIAQLPPTVASLFEGYASVAEIYLTLWEANHGHLAKANALSQSARQGIKMLQQYARVFYIGRPRVWLWQGRYDWLAGKSSKAEQAWYKSLNIAEQLHMPYEQALAHYALGSYATSANRTWHLDSACTIFKELGATYDLDKAEKAHTA